MKKNYQFHLVFSFPNAVINQQLELFAFLNLGIVNSLFTGILSPSDAIQKFYHAENCIYTKDYFQNELANRIMSHGVQLTDIFDALPPYEAQREYFHELETIKSLCLNLLDSV